MEVRLSRLESIVEQMAEAVIATTETIDRLSDRLDALTTQLEEQAQQVQQQSYQIFALSDAVQTLAENQDESLAQLNHLTEVVQHLISGGEPINSDESSSASL